MDGWIVRRTMEVLMDSWLAEKTDYLGIDGWMEGRLIGLMAMDGYIDCW